MLANVKENMQELRLLVKMIPAEQVDPLLRVTIQDNWRKRQKERRSNKSSVARQRHWKVGSTPFWTIP